MRNYVKYLMVLFSQCKDKNLDTYVEEKQRLQDKLESLWLSVKQKNSTFILNEASQNDSFWKAQIPEVRLPKLTSPKFNSNTEEWLLFYDIFKANVD